MLKNQKGVTMTEMLGVLSIVGILGVSVWKLIDHARYRYRLSQVALQVQSLQKGVSRFYAAEGNYKDLSEEGTVQKLIKNGVVPSDMRRGDSAIGHVFNGSVTLANVTYANEASNASTGFSITFSNLYQRICTEVATISWPENDLANMISISIGDKKYVWPAISETLGEGVGVLPISKSEAMDACENATSITWEFR